MMSKITCLNIDQYMAMTELFACPPPPFRVRPHIIITTNQQAKKSLGWNLEKCAVSKISLKVRKLYNVAQYD